MEGANWHYGQELHDLKGTYRTLDCVDGDYDVVNEKKITLGRGVLSREGFAVIDDSKSMALTEDGWVAPRKKGIALYFFGYGHRYLEALNDFYHLCGKTPLLPRFTLGNTEAEYKQLMERFAREKLPFSVAVIDMDWHLVDDVDPKYGKGYTGYTWNRKFFPDPEGFLAWLHGKGMKVTLNVHPADGVRAFEEIYPKMAEALGIDPATEQAVEFDPADPVFMEKYFDILCHDLEKMGVDFWWVDWQQGSTSKLEGLDPLWILNHYHYLDSGWKGTRRITFSRYAEVGSHRYPIGFSGDTAITWESLEYQPYFTATASNIGYGWWSHDIGGHMWGYRDDELMARWVQFGVFSPIHRLHSSHNPFSGKEPWRYNAETREVMNRYLRLRHGLIPYLYTMNRRAHVENQPLIQPMYYAQPEKEECYQVPNEYYFGSELLVSPITAPADKVSCKAGVKTWLPEGIWADFFSGMVYRGGRIRELYRGLEDIPVLMKAGAIVPMKDMQIYDNSVENPKAMEVRIFPAAAGEFTLWEDEGDTPENQEENWVSTELSFRGNKFVIGPAQGNTDVIPQKRSWKLVFCATRYAEPIIKVDGAQTSYEVSYVEDTNSLVVEIPLSYVSSEITVEFERALQIVSNDIGARCFSILEKAQMDYEVKREVWSIVTKAQASEALGELDIDEAVKKSLLEILRA